jgi:hypothetical protein
MKRYYTQDSIFAAMQELREKHGLEACAKFCTVAATQLEMKFSTRTS